MSTRLDPDALFARLARDLPPDLRGHLLIVGSLAAAYHYRKLIWQNAVNTKDADVVIQPAGALRECGLVASRLLALKWRRREGCVAGSRTTPADRLQAIRLYPPRSSDYFLELLALPKRTQATPVLWSRFRLDDGWYGVASFRFMAFARVDRLRSKHGIEYAAPWAMALSNLLSHPTIGHQRMSTAIGGRVLLRSAKDLGRVIALARLASREELEQWPERWARLLRRCFPSAARQLARDAGSGLSALLNDPAVLDEAWHAATTGLLANMRITRDQFRVVGEQVMADAIEPLVRLVR